MESVAVSSSNLDRVGLDGDTLYVRFKNGLVYAYDGLPTPVYHALLLAESVGRFFNQHIRLSYPYHKLERDPFTPA